MLKIYESPFYFVQQSKIYFSVNVGNVRNKCNVRNKKIAFFVIFAQHGYFE